MAQETQGLCINLEGCMAQETQTGALYQARRRWERVSKGKGYMYTVAQRLKRLPPMWETRVQSLGWEDPLEKEMATDSSTSAHGERSLVGYSPRGGKESNTTDRLHFHFHG